MTDEPVQTSYDTRRSRGLRAIARRFFLQISMRQRGLLAEAILGLALARLALVFMPFRKLAAWFGSVRHPSQDAGDATPVLSIAQQSDARLVGWAVTRAARYVPFRAVCLPQAIAAKAMLDRRHIYSVMHFGVAKIEAELSAHAWLDSGPVEVTGFPVQDCFVEVARFI